MSETNDSHTKPPTFESPVVELKLTEEQIQQLEAYMDTFRNIGMTYIMTLQDIENLKDRPMTDQDREMLKSNNDGLHSALVMIYSYMLILTSGLHPTLDTFFRSTLLALDTDRKFIDSSWFANFLNDVTHFLAQRTYELGAVDIETINELSETSKALRAKAEDILSRRK